MVVGTVLAPNGKVTPAERLILGRHRRSERQVDVADRLGVKAWTYRRYEAGTLDPPPIVMRRAGVRRVKPHERLYLARRRAGLSPAELAERVGVSRWWLHLMETGEAPLKRLRDYWRNVL